MGGTELDRPLARQGRSGRVTAIAAIVGLLTYVGGWWIAGSVRVEYDPREQAISELFELGAPWASRGWVVAGLLLSGVALVAFGPALDRGLPGTGRLGPLLVVTSGVFTVLVVGAPCSPGCPGTGTAFNDTAHTITAGAGYLSLVFAPLAFAWRLREVAPRLAAWSWLLGGVAVTGLVVRYLGVIPQWLGAQQRLFNTVADLWYLIVAIRLLRQP
ncbi:MAG: DUF998 domain-containing protein [Nitriliruptoraceae bacterium]